ncbi:MAG: chitobiase/beta-hexosaminidase C-terminal domain-containing protein, partial [candidate division KSB1 bacterium]|nr:chitobiase/beta-hexosaminidase C-terminal domain-containing protein [candidate division KSB1 bacterium]
MNRDLKIVSIFFILISLTFNLRAQDINLQFNPEHGFYNQRINVSITANAQNARIYYTLDGRLPELTASQGTFLYEGPIVINKTSCIRAMAILPDGLRSDVITQTYIFIDDVVQQDYQATINAGFPQRWGTVTPDYGMDPDIVNHPQYGPLLKSALLSLPTMSIVMNIDDLFGSNGIYTNPEQHGVAWERPGSVELIFPDNSQGFQVNCGIRIQGGWFRQHSGTKKHSFRLLFKSQYGPSKLSYPLFGENATDRFDTIVLRAGANDGYAWRDARFTEQYTRDEFGRRLQLATGNAAAHGMFVHLYLNGIY